MEFDEQKKFFPKGKATDVFDKKAAGIFQNDLNNLAYDKHKAQQRNVLLLITLAVCIVCMVYVTVFANYKTYVVRVDNATGQVEVGSRLVTTNYTPQEAEIKHFLSRFVSNIRTIPLHPVLYKINWNTAQHFRTPQAAQKLNNMIASENQLARLGRSTTQVSIRSIQLQPGTNRTYQVRWSEDEYSVSGSATGKKDFYVALFTVTVNPPTKEQELLINPLGLKIADLNYSRENQEG